MLAEFKLAVTRASSTGRSGAARVSVVVRAVPPAGELSLSLAYGCTCFVTDKSLCSKLAFSGSLGLAQKTSSTFGADSERREPARRRRRAEFRNNLLQSCGCGAAAAGGAPFVPLRSRIRSRSVRMRS